MIVVMRQIITMLEAFICNLGKKTAAWGTGIVTLT